MEKTDHFLLQDARDKSLTALLANGNESTYTNPFDTTDAFDNDRNWRVGGIEVEGNTRNNDVGSVQSNVNQYSPSSPTAIGTGSKAVNSSPSYSNNTTTTTSSHSGVVSAGSLSIPYESSDSFPVRTLPMTPSSSNILQPPPPLHTPLPTVPLSNTNRLPSPSLIPRTKSSSNIVTSSSTPITGDAMANQHTNQLYSTSAVTIPTFETPTLPLNITSPPLYHPGGIKRLTFQTAIYKSDTGFGLDLGKTKDGRIIVQRIKDSALLTIPKIKPGDYIISINGHINLSFTDMVNMIRSSHKLVDIEFERIVTTTTSNDSYYDV